MGRATFVALVLLSVLVVVAGVWFFRRDEYPFRFAPAQVTAARVESLRGGVATGSLAAPAPELAGWIGSMERDSSDVPPDPVARLNVDLSDGRRLQLDVGRTVSLGSWTAGPQAGQPPVRLHTESDLYWYVRGLCDALRSG
jgi:hypothetical protein